jgi:hypothetical protein
MKLSQVWKTQYFESYTKALQSGLVSKAEAENDLQTIITERLNKPWDCYNLASKAFFEGQANGISQAIGKNQAHFMKE